MQRYLDNTLVFNPYEYLTEISTPSCFVRVRQISKDLEFGNISVGSCNQIISIAKRIIGELELIDVKQAMPRNPAPYNEAALEVVKRSVLDDMELIACLLVCSLLEECANYFERLMKFEMAEHLDNEEVEGEDDEW